jgi:integrase
VPGLDAAQALRHDAKIERHRVRRAVNLQPSPARLLNLVWTKDDEFGLYLWTAFTTGARRGEVSALRKNRFGFSRQQVRLARNYLVKQGQHIEKASKDGEGRVLSLDPLTCELLQEHGGRGDPLQPAQP